MQRAWIALCSVVLCIAMSSTVFARDETNVLELKRIEKAVHERYLTERGQLFQLRVQQLESPRSTDRLHRTIELIGVLPNGYQQFYSTDNLNAASTISVDKCWPGGSTGYDLTGAGTLAKHLCVWDGGVVKTTHVEFQGRVIVAANQGGIGDHGTHVAGTMVAAGIDTAARGASYEANLTSYDWNDDLSEMASAAGNGMRISNASYGWITGWDYRTTTGGTGHTGWHWYGDAAVSETEDYLFGFYSWKSQALDDITYNAPYYLFFKSGGNDRNDAPDAGVTHYFQDPANGYIWTQSTTTREKDGGNDDYDCVAEPGNAKNIISVGAVEDARGGYIDYPSIASTDFSAYGPTDDGRIKPDLVANGMDLYSTVTTYEREGTPSDTSYGVKMGTSMAAPSAAGSANLIRQFYKETHDGDEMLASTLKGALIHTADEAGNPRKFLGPDYRTGWGMINTAKAADLVVADTSNEMVISEQTVLSGEGHAFSFTWDGSSQIRVTICWTDPPGDVRTSNLLNNRTPQLVNDLDLWIVGPDSSYYPWRLDPENPANAALRDGPNRVDNTEQVNIEEPTAGSYTVYVVPFNALTDGEQTYSMFISGANNDIQLTSAPEYEVASIPDRFEIKGAYPNPFNPSTTIQVRMPNAGELTVDVFNTVGQKVTTLAQSYRQAGTHRIAFNAANLASGVYFVRASMAGQTASTQKVLLLR